MKEHDWLEIVLFTGLFFCVMALAYGIFQLIYPWLLP